MLLYTKDDADLPKELKDPLINADILYLQSLTATVHTLNNAVTYLAKQVEPGKTKNAMEIIEATEILLAKAQWIIEYHKKLSLQLADMLGVGKEVRMHRILKEMKKNNINFTSVQ